MNTYARPVRELRNDYNEIIELAQQGNQIIITKNGREAAVIIGTEAYKDFEVFLYRQQIKRELAKTKESTMSSNAEWIDENELWAKFEDL